MPITRRMLLKSAMFGVCAVPGSALRISHAPKNSGPARLDIGRVVFDARRSHALAFAETTRAFGMSTCALYQGDVHRSCPGLFAHMRAQQTAVAGLTDFPTLLLLQAMAVDAGMHLRLRVHHRQANEGVHIHEAFGEPIYRDLFHSSANSLGGDWAHEVARLVISLPAWVRPTKAPVGRLGGADSSVLAARTLVTWVIA